MDRIQSLIEECAGDVISFGLIEFLVEKAGADKMVFLLGFNHAVPRINLGRVLRAKIDSEVWV